MTTKKMHKVIPVRIAILAAVACTAIPPIQSQSENPDYLLKPGDTISMKVFDEPEMDTISRITPEGSIQFPFIGNIHLTGKTLTQIREEIYRQYDADYLVDPQISFQVLEYAPINIKIRGRVNRPGFVTIPPEENYNILDVIAAAGDITPEGNEKRVEIHRKANDGSPNIIIVDLSKKGTTTPDPSKVFIQPNDVIVVPESIF
ncbi:polysaccharide biosynthesis/export family protein [Pelagicoccus sp. SDUM812005]|uniref:polysaccharide biosynthesis/export family protein n=1 Tax=Pelagicoccus sp. SDUM812005 TaxID=3041257 RepID=UPI00280DE3FA|nr:polysaccharide biosynthesis/export family protein [Pelagicoccus sp. SDUM812005]MDQ8183717.1 polysaccharide export protein [Pelagicoccus sp. SDUM812005]